MVCPGSQLDWNRTEELEGALGRDGVSSNYRFDLAPRTWDFIRDTRSGTAVFMMPSGPIKCAGAPQKIAYLASDQEITRESGDCLQSSCGPLRAWTWGFSFCSDGLACLDRISGLMT